MSYSVKETGGVHEIIERGTNHVVATRKDNESARKLVRSLNLGCGFNGFTPSFFCYKYELPIDVVLN